MNTQKKFQGKVYKCRDYSFALDRKPIIMGILNITPDSFSDGGKYNSFDKAIEHGHEMFNAGADIIDIGGESSRPYADPISFEEEKQRVLPIIKELSSKIPISIDTYKPEIAKLALENGACIVNDITGFVNSEMIKTANEYSAGIVIMHMLGTPGTMQKNPEYTNVVEDVKIFLEGQAQKCIESGISKDSIMLDPGIGFGKTFDHNFEILRNLTKFSDSGYPVLLGASRKSFMKATGQEETSDRLEGSITAAVVGFLEDVSIVRVHDIAETKRALDIAYAIRFGL